VRFSRKFLVLAAPAAALAAAVAVTTPAGATITPAPFTEYGITYCTSYHDYLNGCTGIDTVTSPPFTVKFNPTQDSLAGKVIKLTMNSAATYSGAVNTYNEQNFSPPFTMSQTLQIPCDANGQVEDWPAAWTVGIGNPAGTDEYDFFEGQQVNGVNVATLAIHYMNAAGQPDSRGVAPAGFNPCGIHIYTVHVTLQTVTFTWATKVVATFTAASLGITSFAANSQYLIDDLAADPALAGPTVPGSVMEIVSSAFSPS
jgi:hypothetical protein